MATVGRQNGTGTRRRIPSSDGRSRIRLHRCQLRQMPLNTSASAAAQRRTPWQTASGSKSMLTPHTRIHLHTNTHPHTPTSREGAVGINAQVFRGPAGLQSTYDQYNYFNLSRFKHLKIISLVTFCYTIRRLSYMIFQHVRLLLNYAH